MVFILIICESGGKCGFAQLKQQRFYYQIYNYNSTIMSKAKKIRQTVIPDSDSDEDSSVPIVAEKKSKKQQVEAKKLTKKAPKKQDSDEQDSPTPQKKPSKVVKADKGAAKKLPVPKKKQESSSQEESSSEEKPKKVVKAKSPLQKAIVSKKKAKKESSSEEEQSSEEKPKKAVKAKSPVQKAIVAKKKPVKQSSSESESEEEEKPRKLSKSKSPSTLKPKNIKKKVESSSQEEAAPTPKVKAQKNGGKKTSPALKPQVKKVAKKESSSDSDEESSEEKPAPKAVVKAKSPLQKPLQKAKSPVQKPLGKAKKVESSDEDESSEPPKKVSKKKVKKVESSDSEEEQVPEPAPKKAQKKVEKMVDEDDEEGQFEVCVKGLSFQAYEDDIKELFENCGEVINCKLLLRPDGKSKGLAFVKFNKKSSFNKALELNETEQFGRNINVEQSQGKPQGGRDGGFKKDFNNNRGDFNKGNNNNNRNKFQDQGNADITTPTLFIGGLSYNSSVETITQYFSQAGDVVRARIVTDRQTGKPRGFGYVEFPDVQTAKSAYQSLNGGNLDGRQIRLDSASERERPQGGGFQGGQGGGFQGGNRAPRNPGNSRVDLSQDDKLAKKGAMGSFQGKKVAL